ncbi:MAG: GDP-L-fucose synthase [Lentisphaerae bacterium]|nr:GDP-L-fucose synthase [Lentisphaerota bacterium]
MSSQFEKTLVLGHRGMVGSAVVRRMAAKGLPAPMTAGRQELDCLDQAAVRRYIAEKRPTSVVVAAAKVGGIEANSTQMSEFMYENLMVATNVVEACFRAGVPRVLFLGSSCIYPRLAPQPIREDALLTGPLEPSNEGYAIAKIAGMKLCQYYRRQYGVCYHSAMPTNLYGPGDSYHPRHSHVLPALIRRFEEARVGGVKSVTLWGTGSALREFLHVDDLADAVLFVMGLDNPPDWVNVGSGEEVSIRDLAEKVRVAVGADCELAWDASKPDGTPRKLLDCSLIRSLGWTPRILLDAGLPRTVEDYRREGATGIRRD